MPTHTHAKSKKTHTKDKNAHKKDSHAFAKGKKNHEKPHHLFAKGNTIPLLTVALLQEIRALVHANNKSEQSDEMVICQIYKESSFNQNAGKGGSGAKGLMQLRKPSVMQAYVQRLKEQLGRSPSDKQKKHAFQQGAAMHSSAQMFEKATNIQLGTEYLQYCIDLKGSISAGYQKYRGPEEFDYYSKISACAVKLKNNPNSIQPLIDMNK